MIYLVKRVRASFPTKFYDKVQAIAYAKEKLPRNIRLLGYTKSLNVGGKPTLLKTINWRSEVRQSNPPKDKWIKVKAVKFLKNGGVAMKV